MSTNFNQPRFFRGTAKECKDFLNRQPTVFGKNWTVTDENGYVCYLTGS